MSKPTLHWAALGESVTTRCCGKTYLELADPYELTLAREKVTCQEPITLDESFTITDLQPYLDELDRNIRDITDLYDAPMYFEVRGPTSAEAFAEWERPTREHAERVAKEVGDPLREAFRKMAAGESVEWRDPAPRTVADGWHMPDVEDWPEDVLDKLWAALEEVPKVPWYVRLWERWRVFVDDLKDRR